MLEKLEAIRELMCDKYCKYPLICKNQGDLDKIFFGGKKESFLWYAMKCMTN